MFLAYAGVNDARIKEIEECCNLAEVWKDANGHPYARIWHCMNRGLCPVCDEIEAWSQSLDRLVFLAKLFNAAKKEFRIWRVDFTVASDVWPKIPRDNLPSFARIGYETMQEYFDSFLGWKVKFGIDIAPQYWHSNNAGLGFYPHLHCVIPRLFVDAETGRLSTTDFMWLNNARIKTIWRRRVEEAYGRSSARRGFGGRGSEMFSVRITAYDHVGPPLPERLKYVYRGIVFNYEGIVKNGMDYLKWDRDFIRWTLLSRHVRHLGFGLFAPRNLSAKSQFMRTVGLDYETRIVRSKRRRKKVCPEDGLPVDIPLNDKETLVRSAARERGLKQLVSDFFAELRREADGRYVPYHKPRRMGSA